jgi:hypothetical protein
MFQRQIDRSSLALSVFTALSSFSRKEQHNKRKKKKKNPTPYKTNLVYHGQGLNTVED